MLLKEKKRVINASTRFESALFKGEIVHRWCGDQVTDGFGSTLLQVWK